MPGSSRPSEHQDGFFPGALACGHCACHCCLYILEVNLCNAKHVSLPIKVNVVFLGPSECTAYH